MALTDTDQHSTVERLAVEAVRRVAPKLQAVPQTTRPESVAPASDARLEVYQAIASVIVASAAVLATRLLLLLALVGGFVLALIAVQASSWMSLAVLCAYAILILIPMVALEVKTKWTGGA